MKFLLFSLLSLALATPAAASSFSPSHSVSSPSSSSSKPQEQLYHYDHTDEDGDRTTISYKVTPLQHLYHFESNQHDLHQVKCEGNSTLRLHFNSRPSAAAGGSFSSFPSTLPAGSMVVLDASHSGCNSPHDMTGVPLIRRLTQPLRLNQLHTLSVASADSSSHHLLLSAEPAEWKECFESGEISFHSDNLHKYYALRQQQQEEQASSFSSAARSLKSLASPSSAASTTQKTFNWGFNYDSTTQSAHTTLSISSGDESVTISCAACYANFQLGVNVQASWYLFDPSANTVSVTATASANASIELQAAITGTLSKTFTQQLLSATILPTVPLFVIGVVPVTLQVAASISAAATISTSDSFTITGGAKMDWATTRGMLYQGGKESSINENDTPFTSSLIAPTLKTSAPSATFQLALPVTLTFTLDAVASLALSLSPYISGTAQLDSSSTTCTNPSSNVGLSLAAGMTPSLTAGFGIHWGFFDYTSPVSVSLTFPGLGPYSLGATCFSIGATTDDATNVDVPQLMMAPAAQQIRARPAVKQLEKIKVLVEELQRLGELVESLEESEL